MPDFVDVLPLLSMGAQSLRHGQLIASPNLTLFEATSAVELGEPRMDTGAISAEELAFPAFERRTLLPQEICWMMDRVLGYEVSQRERRNSPYFRDLRYSRRN